MTLRINSTAPDFKAETTQGPIEFHKWIGDGWAILFSHPKDFTPVCTTELGYMAGLKPEFDKRNTKILGLSVDPVGNHEKWAKDIEETQGHKVTYPMIGDPELKVATAYDMLPEGAGTTSEGRTAADNATVRSVFIIGPDKKIKAMLTYPMSTGRNFDEVLRLLDSCQLTAKHQVATPVNWKNGEDVIIVPAVSDEAAKAKYPERLEGAEALPAHRPAAEVTLGDFSEGRAAQWRAFSLLESRRAGALPAKISRGRVRPAGRARQAPSPRCPGASRPACSYWRAGEAWSMKRSGRTIGRTFRPWSSKPVVARCCSTWLAKPPTAPSSIVISTSCSRASRRIRSVSSGLAKRASATVVLRPLAPRSSAATRHSPRRVPKLRMAILLPSRSTRPLPISSGVPRAGSSMPTPSPRG